MSMSFIAVLFAMTTLNASDDDFAPFAQLALDCLHQEYPNKIAHVMQSDDDVAPPRRLTPSFYGCFDWHSAVHGHWLLVRLSRLHPQAEYTPAALEKLAQSFAKERLLQEAAYLSAPGRASFERPYGLAWLLQLIAELDEWDHPDARQWREDLSPLERIAVARISTWLPKLAYPIRVGEHAQTAFAFGLMLDYARQVNNIAFAQLLEERTLALYEADRNCPLAYEPGGQDFLSPCLAEADLMRRVLPESEFADWLTRFMPQIGTSDSWLPLARVTDRADGKLAHLDGLNLSRAWMLDGIHQALPEQDPRRVALQEARDAHSEAGLKGIASQHYAGSHWLGSFATYLTTRRGVAKEKPDDQ